MTSARLFPIVKLLLITIHASHEEADDRKMFRIHQLYKKYTIKNPYIKDSLSISCDS